MKKSIIFVFSVLFSFLLLNSCSDEDNTEKSRMCTVSYDADTGGEILNTSVAYGEVAHKTDWKPSKPGYTFLGWYYTDEFGEETEYPFTIAVTE
ncbi:MAG: InlB B-repeat-containing protein, partial [Treponema sp.]|nr:InlB B-repeat-containing protein [Treponema sp.]